MCITNKHNHLWPCLWIFLFIFQIYVHKTVISLKKAESVRLWLSRVVFSTFRVRLCGVYNIYEDLIDTAKTTKIIYNTESGKVKFDSSRGACRGQLFKFNERIANT